MFSNPFSELFLTVIFSFFLLSVNSTPTSSMGLSGMCSIALVSMALFPDSGTDLVCGPLKP